MQRPGLAVQWKRGCSSARRPSPVVSRPSPVARRQSPVPLVLPTRPPNHATIRHELEARRVPRRIALERELAFGLHAEQLPAAIEAQAEFPVMSEWNEIE